MFFVIEKVPVLIARHIEAWKNAEVPAETYSISFINVVVFGVILAASVTLYMHSASV